MGKLAWSSQWHKIKKDAKIILIKRDKTMKMKIKSLAKIQYLHLM